MRAVSTTGITPLVAITAAVTRGGFSGATCPSDESCDFPVEHQCGIADGGGACRSRPTVCDEIFAPVVGSDGQVYDNACFAHGAGADDCSPAPTR